MGNGPSSSLDSDDEDDAPPQATEHASKDHSFVTRMRASLEELLSHHSDTLSPELRWVCLQMHRYLIMHYYHNHFDKNDADVKRERLGLYKDKGGHDLLRIIAVLFDPLDDGWNLRPQFNALLRRLPHGPPSLTRLH